MDSARHRTVVAWVLRVVVVFSVACILDVWWSSDSWSSAAVFALFMVGAVVIVEAVERLWRARKGRRAAEG